MRFELSCRLGGQGSGKDKGGIRATLLTVGSALVLAACDGGGGTANIHPPNGNSVSANPPNILFVIMDDVGIDQMQSFGYGGATGPFMPNMDLVAKAGVRFRNNWSMPECSPGRAAAFLGQYPLRTGIYQAIGPNDLANSQVSPYAATIAKLLKNANYENAMFGKFHLAGPENNSAGNMTPRQLGWDYFYGWIGGLPGSIDTTAGGVAPAGTYSCGFVPGVGIGGGSDSGACYQPDMSCKPMHRSLQSNDPPGLQCLESGGVFVPDATCGSTVQALDFNTENAYYVSPLVIIDGDSLEEVPLTDPRARGYRTRIETDAAIRWINSRSGNKPWMATVSYSAAHTPWQQPPSSMLANPAPGLDLLECTGLLSGRTIQDKMTEAMDKEFGRLLVETGLAAYDQNGNLIYDAKASNTVIVIVGDNGTLGSAVKYPFQVDQAKGTAYQTGIWTPLIIAGPMVEQPDRDIENMVNMVDVFEFFGEVAGIDVHAQVNQPVDSVALLPYLQNPGQGTLRTVNFSMGGVNYQANGARNAPCVINTTCTQIPVSKGVCEDNGGVWWGPGYTDSSVIPKSGGYQMCYEVNKALYENGQPMLSILPELTVAARQGDYKLVRNQAREYLPVSNTVETVTTNELYIVNEQSPTPLLDTPDRNLWPSSDPEIVAQFNSLTAVMDRILASDPYCAGDGNRDGVVNAADLDNWSKIASSWGLSSVYDFFVGGVLDGLTNSVDGDIVQNNLGVVCPPKYGTY